MAIQNRADQAGTGFLSFCSGIGGGADSPTVARAHKH
jgi:hypothetical protein